MLQSPNFKENGPHLHQHFFFHTLSLFKVFIQTGFISKFSLPCWGTASCNVTLSVLVKGVVGNTCVGVFVASLYASFGTLLPASLRDICVLVCVCACLCKCVYASVCPQC